VPAITISRQYGSGGSEIAQLLGTRLGWPVIDNEFVGLVSKKAGLPKADVERLEERVPGLLERLAQAFALASPEVFVTGETPTTGPTPEDEIHRVTELVITEAVKHDVVLVGRGAQAYLATREKVLHVFLAAPLDVRIARTMERLKVDRKEAERTVDRVDRERREYVKTYYGRGWDDPTNYHMLLNTDRLSFPEVVDLVASAVRRRGWRTATSSS
jgi:cytidylate kinase